MALCKGRHSLQRDLPGAVQTNIEESMPKAELDPKGMARAVEFFSLGTAYLDPSEIASLALFLASDEARYINGSVVRPTQVYARREPMR